MRTINRVCPIHYAQTHTRKDTPKSRAVWPLSVLDGVEFKVYGIKMLLDLFVKRSYASPIWK